jgi:outer membrane protein assembly factor BamB
MPAFRRLPVPAGLAALLLAAVAGPAADWPQFRGPDGSGIAPRSEAPLAPSPNSLAWKAAAPAGLSSPVVAGGRVYLTGLDQGKLVTLAWETAQGRPLWRREAPAATLETVHEINSPATPTPCADDAGVVAYFGSFGLIAYGPDGKEQWRRPIPTPRSLYGSASSPLLYRDLVLLVLDNDANLPGSKLSQSRLLAVRRATGEVAWETPRPLHRSSWATPGLWRGADGDELVVPGHGRVCAYDPATGVEKWFVTGFAREAVASPVFGGGRVYVASAMGGQPDEKPDPAPLWQAMLAFDRDGDGRIARAEATGHFTFPLRPEVPPGHPGFGIPLPSAPDKRQAQQERVFQGMDKDRDGFWTREEFAANLGQRPFRPRLVAIRAGGQGDVTETHVAWELNRAIPEVPSPLWQGGILYLVRNGGMLAAVNAEDGKLLYQERLEAGGDYNASPVLARGHLFLVSQRGVLTVVRAGRTFERAHQHDLGEAGAVTPAVDDTTLYVRTQGHLWAFRARSNP